MKISAFRGVGALAAALALSGPIAASASAVYAPPAAIPERDTAADIIRGGLTSLATVLTNAGVAIITNRMTQAGTAPKNIGWGIGTTAAAVTDTTLQTESAPTTSGGRTVGTESRATTTVTSDTYQVAGTVTATSTLAITEAGLFDAVTAGNMLVHAVFSAVNVNSGDSIAFTFQTKFVAA